MFADIVNTLGFGVERFEIDFFDELAPEEDVVCSFFGGWAEGDCFAPEGARDADPLIVEAGYSMRLNDAQQIVRAYWKGGVSPA